jgi:hypothetical protein
MTSRKGDGIISIGLTQNSYSEELLWEQRWKGVTLKNLFPSSSYSPFIKISLQLLKKKRADNLRATVIMTFN